MVEGNGPAGAGPARPAPDDLPVDAAGRPGPPRSAPDDRTSDRPPDSDTGDTAAGGADGSDAPVGGNESVAELEDQLARTRQEVTVAREAAADAREEAAAARQDLVLAQAAQGAIDLQRDPIVDVEVRRQEAGVDDDNPFGRPGAPMSRRSPFRVGFSAALGVGMAWLLYRALVDAQSVLVLVLVAAFLAIGLNPAVSRLERLGMRRGAAVGLVFLGALLFFSIAGYAILPPLVEQGTKFVQALPGYVRDLAKNPTIHDLDQRFNLIDKVQNYLEARASQAPSNIVSIGSTIASTVFKGLTILILTLYFLSSFNTITDTAYRLVPRSRRARVTLLGEEILGRVGGYVAGAFVVALIAGTSSLIYLSVARAPYPLALALVVMITDIIPLVGATIGAVLVTIVTFIVSVPLGIATFIFFLIYQQVENYLIYPRVMKRSVDVNPAAAIVGALVGGTLLGVVGALIAVPTTAAIQLILREVLLPRQDSV